MVKELYLVYAEHLGRYIFYESAKGHNRREISKENLIGQVGSLIDAKRNSVLYLSGISKEVRESLERKLNGTKVEVQVK